MDDSGAVGRRQEGDQMIGEVGNRAGRLRGLSSAIAALFLATLLIAGPVSAAASSATDTVGNFYATLLDVMKKGPRFSERQRYDELAPVVQRTFDLAYMTRMAIGPSWASLSPAQQQSATEAFTRYVTATYADRFDNYSGEQLRVESERATPSGTVVLSQIVKADGSPVVIDYLMRRNGDAWQVGDVQLTGTISELATRRAEFSSILRRDGINGLIAVLNRKADMLVASAAPR
jgi:phospholipid transport system substrate-binding protein